MGTVNGCTHRHPHHHGTLAAYRQCGCHCDQCMRAQRRYNKAHRNGIRTPNDLHPAGAAQQLARTLHVSYTFTELANLTGLSTRTLSDIESDPGRRVTQDTMRRLRDAPLRRPDHMSHAVDATGTRRRLQGLAILGHSSARIGAATSKHPVTVGQIKSGKKRMTDAQFAWDVAAYAREHGADRLTDIDARRCSTLSTGYGYLSLWAWDEEEIDDPDATPADGSVEPTPAYVKREAVDVGDVVDLDAVLRAVAA